MESMKADAHTVAITKSMLHECPGSYPAWISQVNYTVIYLERMLEEMGKNEYRSGSSGQTFTGETQRGD